MEDFLQKWLVDAGSIGESKFLINIFLKRFLTHSNLVKRVVLNPAMDHWAVSGQVATALAALQPNSAHFFISMIDEVVERLGLAVLSSTGEEKPPSNTGIPGAATTQGGKPASTEAASSSRAWVTPVPPEEVEIQLCKVLTKMMESDRDTKLT